MSSIAIALQGSTPTSVGGTDVIRFAGGAFAARIQAGEYNASTHVRNSGGSDISSANTPNNNTFISQTDGTGGDSQADWGDGTEDLDQITTAEAALKITVSDASSFSVEDAVAYFYDGSTPATPPVGLTCVLAEVGNANFTAAEGSGAALALADQSSPATSHDYYLVPSVSPDSFGLKSFALRFEATLY